MKMKIAILRGINVGGNRKILMQDLRGMFQELGFTNVSTYIQSGNVFFGMEENIPEIELSNHIENAIKDKFAFDVPVIVRDVDTLEETVNENSFYSGPDMDIDRLHLTFLKEEPTSENRRNAESVNYEPDKFMIKGKNVFLYCAGKYHETKLSNKFFESKLKVPATTRNWKTVLKLLELGKQTQ